jgi:L-lactate dehydrogenase complex protein LldG
VGHFVAQCTTAGGHVYVVSDPEAAVAKVMELLRLRALRKVLLGRGTYFDTLRLPERLSALAIGVVSVDMLASAIDREALFAAEVGISGVKYLVAETGTVTVETRPGEPRSLSLLPPVHIAVAHRTQLLPDLFDLFQNYSSNPENGLCGPGLPSCVALITGPSKTGDIELRLVTGVHGPGEIHVILVEQ